MPMLKTISAHNGCTNVMNYLEKDGRAVTRDFNNICNRENWAFDMDTTREMLGHTRHRNSISYRHYIYSPDPWDKADIDTIRICAIEWAKENFPDCQWTVITHVDSGKPHAHIVVNSSDLNTGKKVQISNSRVIKLAQSAQEIAARHNLTPLPDLPLNGVDVKRSSLVRITKGEQSLLETNRSCYKMDIRDAVDAAVYYASDVVSFKEVMQILFNIEVYESRSGFTFVCPDGKNKAASRSLGEAYTVEGVECRYGKRSFEHRKDLPDPKPRFIADNFINRIRVQSLFLNDNPDLYKLQLFARREGIGSIKEFMERLGNVSSRCREMESELKEIKERLSPLLAAEYHLGRKNLDRDSEKWLEHRGINEDSADRIKETISVYREKQGFVERNLDRSLVVEGRYKDFLVLFSQYKRSDFCQHYSHEPLYGTPVIVHKKPRANRAVSRKQSAVDLRRKKHAYQDSKTRKQLPVKAGQAFDMKRIKAIQAAKKNRQQKGRDY